jgi:hypothetical protein
MGKWTVYENNRGFFSFTHLNLLNGTTFNCGELRRDTPNLMILQWILESGSSTSGDVVQFADGQVVTLNKEARA